MSAQVRIRPHVDVQVEVARNAARRGAGAPLPGMRSRPPASTPGGTAISMLSPLPVRMLRLVPSAASVNVTGSCPTMSGATALALPHASSPLRGLAAARRAAAEQAGEDVADVEVAVELDAARAGTRAAAERARERLGVESLRHAVGAHGRALEPIVFLALLLVAQNARTRR